MHKQISMYLLILIRFITSFLNINFFKISIPITFYTIIVFISLTYYVVEKMQRKIILATRENTNIYILKQYYKIIYSVYLFIGILSTIILCLDKNWQVNLVFVSLFNIIIFCHLKELNDSFKPEFYNDFFLSNILKLLSFLNISGFTYCFTMNNQELGVLNYSIYLLYVVIYLHFVFSFNSTIKCFRENSVHFLYNKYKLVLITDITHFIITSILITLVFTINDYKNLASKEQNGYEYVAFFCCLVNGAYSFFGLFFTIIYCLTIPNKIKDKLTELQNISNRNTNEVIVVVSPSDDSNENIDICIGKNLSDSPTPPNEVATQSLSEPEVV